MTLIRRTGGMIALTLLLACSSDSLLLPKDGLRFAVAQLQCGPADGGAVAIYLARDPANGPGVTPPYARIYIDLMTTALDGRQISVGGDHPDAFATFNRATNDYETASSGFIVARSSPDNSEITGAVDITFPTAGHLVKEFTAPLFPNNSLCP